MNRSLLKYFVWISLLSAAAMSCRSSKIIFSDEQAEMMSDSLHKGSFEKITLKARVIYQERELSGLMLIKNAGDENYKIAFFNELGLTYFEGTLENSSKHNKIAVNNIAPILDNKPFLKNFEKSLKIVFTDNTSPRLHAPMPPCPQASKSPRSHASKPPRSLAPLLDDKIETSLTVQLKNGFILELKPQR